MTPRRDPERRWPVGAALVFWMLAGGAIWAGVAAVLVVSVLRPAPVIYQGESHEDR